MTSPKSKPGIFAQLTHIHFLSTITISEHKLQYGTLILNAQSISPLSRPTDRIRRVTRSGICGVRAQVHRHDQRSHPSGLAWRRAWPYATEDTGAEHDKNSAWSLPDETANGSLPRLLQLQPRPLLALTNLRDRRPSCVVRRTCWRAGRVGECLSPPRSRVDAQRHEVCMMRAECRCSQLQTRYDHASARISQVRSPRSVLGRPTPASSPGREWLRMERHLLYAGYLVTG